MNSIDVAERQIRVNQSYEESYNNIISTKHKDVNETFREEVWCLAFLDTSVLLLILVNKEISKNALHFQMKSDMLETSLSTLRKPETAETEMSTTVMSTHTTGNYY